MTSTLNSTSMNDVSAKELPLIDDIRFFGQLLGDTIREQEGEETYELIETISNITKRPSCGKISQLYAELEEQLAARHAVSHGEPYRDAEAL